MSNREKEIALIKKLFANAVDAATTEEEAAAFMRKVQTLLAKHNLDESVLHTKIDEEPVDSESVKVILPTSWFATLAASTAKMYFCAVYINNQTKTYFFIGKRHNRIVSIYMFKYFMKTITRLSLERYKDQANRYQFSKGAAIRLSIRIMDELNNIKSPKNNSSGLPALYDSESQVVKDYMDALELKKARANKITLNTALLEGYNAANNISFNNQIDRKENSNFLLTTG